jgi:hypothetical protein
MNNSINLSPELSYLRCKLFALLCVLPFRCFLALDDLQQVNMFLLEFLLLKEQFVEAFFGVEWETRVEGK